MESANIKRNDFNKTSPVLSYQRLAAVIKQSENGDGFRWSEYVSTWLEQNPTPSPLDLAVLTQANLETIQVFYQANPAALTLETLKHACQFGACPGVIGFLAQQKPELVSQKCVGSFVANEYLLYFAMQSGPGQMRPSEDDIRALVELWPASVVTSMGQGQNMFMPLQTCRLKQYSQELFDFMISKVPDTVECFELGASPISEEDMPWITRVLQEKKVKGVVSWCQEWEGQTFFDFLDLLLIANCHLDNVYLQAPVNKKDRLAHSVILERLASLSDRLNKHNSAPKIRSLEINFKHSSTSWYSLLDLLVGLPVLEDLTLDVYRGLEYATPPLCNLVVEGRLKSLGLSFKTQNAPNVKIPLMSLLNAVKHNSTITDLTVAGIDMTRRFSEYEPVLLDLVQKNTTLQELTFRQRRLVRWWKLHQQPVCLRGNPRHVAFYIHLNRCGRKAMRDPSTTPEEFLSCLEAAGSSEMDAFDPTSLQYCLLRDGVSNWVGYGSN